jgi:hypothetical protein
MSRAKESRNVVVRLVEGRSARHEMVLVAGEPLPPMDIGTSGSWRIEARHVAGSHVLLAWSGAKLFAGARRGQVALLDGFPLGARWTEVKMPSDLRFGNARLAIGRCAKPDDTTTPGSEVTRLDDARLQAALRASREDEITSVADVDVPDEARRTSARGSPALAADDDEPTTVTQGPRKSIVDRWLDAAVVPKSIAILLGPTMFCVLFAVRCVFGIF